MAGELSEKFMSEFDDFIIVCMLLYCRGSEMSGVEWSGVE